MIDRTDKVWKTFLDYKDLLSSEGRAIGLDIFGTEQISSMALDFTKAHYINQLNENINSMFTSESEIKGEC
mgnify:CR=1 FL=1